MMRESTRIDSLTVDFPIPFRRDPNVLAFPATKSVDAFRQIVFAAEDYQGEWSVLQDVSHDGVMAVR